jgi:oligopeptide/dipeptide ABC transporter ATP-binding protein
VVLYLGRVVERATRDALFSSPRHPYTRALLAAVPEPDPRLASRVVAATVTEEGTSTPPGAGAGGCAFAPRCAHAIDRCRDERPLLEAAVDGHAVACHRWRDSVPI